MNKQILGLALLCVSVSGIIVSQKKTMNHGYIFEDEYGRMKLFHGVNAVYKIPPYAPATDKFNTVDSITEEDAANLQKWGFNVVRLGVMWPGAEPQKGVWDMDYLKKMRGIADTLGKYGVWTIVDLHQDLGSRYVCGEGIPDWAVTIRSDAAAFPAPVAKGPYPNDAEGYPQLEWCLNKSFGMYYIAYTVQSVFQNLYENTNDAADHFALFWQKVATVFKDLPTLLGYELINEPFPGDCYKHPSLILPGKGDKNNLYPLYNKAAAAIREVDQNGLIFFEKAITNAVGSLGFPSVPGGDQYKNRTVYSWHNYCGTVDRSGNPRNFLLCEGQQAVQWSQELKDVDEIGAGSFITEFGAVSGNNTKALQDIQWVVDKADDEITSWAYWQWKAFHDITTASNEVESFYNADGTLQKQKVDVLSRAYAQTINGLATISKYTSSTHTYHLKFVVDATNVANRDKPTEIYIAPILAASKNKQVTVVQTPADSVTFTINELGMMNVVMKDTVGAGSSIELTISPSA